MSENFTEINDFILDQIYGYQDANEVKNNTLRLRDALSLEHTWSPIDDTDLGKHKDIPYTGLKTSEVNLSVRLGWYDANGTWSAEIPNNTFDIIYEVESPGLDHHFCPRGITAVATQADDDDYFTFTGKITFFSEIESDPGVPTSGTSETVYFNRGIRLNTRLTIFDGSSNHGYVDYTGKLTYITNSPPHKFFHLEDFGYFDFALRNKETGEIVANWLCRDPHWFVSEDRKDDPELIKAKPHPFTEYLKGKQLPENLEIILFDMRGNPYNIEEHKTELFTNKLINGDLPELSKSQLEPDYVKDLPLEFTDFVRIIKIDESLKEEEKREN